MVCWNQITGRGSRIALVLVVMAGLLATAFPSSAQEDAQEWPETVIGFGARPSDHEGGYEAFECEGEQLALVVTDYPGCGEFGGEHVRGWYVTMGFRTTNAGNYGPVPLTGKLEARLYWDGGGEVKHWCEWHEGEFRGCSIVLPKWPPYGTPFQFECYSQDDAIGGWAECFLEHT